MPSIWAWLDRALLEAEGFQAGIVSQLRSAILYGHLKPGVPLPSTRTLAHDLGIARQTVVAAYERLADEGYVEAAHGSVTRVSRVLPEALLHVAHHPKKADSPKRPTKTRLSSRGAAIAQLALTPARAGASLLAPGVPALDEFPWRTWEKLYVELWRSRPTGLLGYGDPRGHLPLREAIAVNLGSVRGLACDAEQVFITAGSQQAIDLAARLLADVGDEAWVEEPAYVAGRNALVAAGLKAVPISVDDEGLNCALGEAVAPNARLALVTPSHQYPLGAVMSLRRRLGLLDWAERHDAWIVEDDYDSEFRYAGRPLQPLAALARANGRVVYVGTFSKVLAPALRLGFMVVPRRLVDAFLSGRGLMDRQPAGPSQSVLAEFIMRGHLATHIRRMRGLYEERRDALMMAIHEHGRGLLTASPPDCGLHVIAWLGPDAGPDEAIYRRAVQSGLQTPSLSAYYAGKSPRPGLLVGFASTSSEMMVPSVITLAAASR
jgi:GntR family transcriptional regulator/MocR family aminotransferase